MHRARWCVEPGQQATAHRDENRIRRRHQQLVGRSLPLSEQRKRWPCGKHAADKMPCFFGVIGASSPGCGGCGIAVLGVPARLCCPRPWDSHGLCDVFMTTAGQRQSPSLGSRWEQSAQHYDVPRYGRPPHCDRPAPEQPGTQAAGSL